jgi:hypothetical protein
VVSSTKVVARAADRRRSGVVATGRKLVWRRHRHIHTARSWETVALDVPLRFPVPPLARTIDGAESYWWRLIEYATEIEDPMTFPTFEHAIQPQKLRVCRRYIDAVAGLAVLLRHFYSVNERANFATVLKLLRAEAVAAVSPHNDEQIRQLDAWKRAEGMTRQRSPQNQAIKRLIADGRAPNDPDLERYPDAAPPEQTISDYFYGDHLHWDSKRDVVEEREKNPFLDLYRYEFFKAAAGLSHLYVGFATLVETAIGSHSHH